MQAPSLHCIQLVKHIDFFWSCRYFNNNIITLRHTVAYKFIQIQQDFFNHQNFQAISFYLYFF